MKKIGTDAKLIIANYVAFSRIEHNLLSNNILCHVEVYFYKPRCKHHEKFKSTLYIHEMYFLYSLQAH